VSTLRQLQNDFQSFILHGGNYVGDQVQSTEKVSAETRLDVYYQAYRLRLLEALGVDFPALQAFVGTKRFERIGLEYIDAYPSEHFSIRYFGRAMSRFLGALPYRREPWLAELASFEWALGEAFDAPDALPLTAKALSAIPLTAWPELRLHLHPSVRRLNFRWHVPAVWQAVDRHETPTPPVRNEPPMPWLIWRRDLKNYFRSLQQDEAWALDAIRAGLTFGEICEGLGQWMVDREAAVRAARLLRLWVEEGLLVSGE
jgi:hypothetical protein